MERVRSLRTLDDPAAALPFIAPLLGALRSEVSSAAAVLGFVGTPWTLAAYAMEGSAERHCLQTKVRTCGQCSGHYSLVATAGVCSWGEITMRCLASLLAAWQRWHPKGAAPCGVCVPNMAPEQMPKHSALQSCT